MQLTWREFWGMDGSSTQEWLIAGGLTAVNFSLYVL